MPSPSVQLSSLPQMTDLALIRPSPGLISMSSLITGIIWITGDITSPFSFLYNLAVMNGAILLFYRGAFFTAGCSSLCYRVLFWVGPLFNHGNGMPRILVDSHADGSQYRQFLRDRRPERISRQQTQRY